MPRDCIDHVCSKRRSSYTQGPHPRSHWSRNGKASNSTKSSSPLLTQTYLALGSKGQKRDQAGVQDVPNYSTEVDLVHKNVSEDPQAGYQDAKKALLDSKKHTRKEFGILLIPKVERQRLTNQLVPSMQRCFEWISTNRAEYFSNQLSFFRHDGRWRPEVHGEQLDKKKANVKVSVQSIRVNSRFTLEPQTITQQFDSLGGLTNQHIVWKILSQRKRSSPTVMMYPSEGMWNWPSGRSAVDLILVGPDPSYTPTRSTSAKEKKTRETLMSAPNTVSLVEQPPWSSSWMETTPSVSPSCAHQLLGTWWCHLTTGQECTKSRGCQRHTSWCWKEVSWTPLAWISTKLAEKRHVQRKRSAQRGKIMFIWELCVVI